MAKVTRYSRIPLIVLGNTLHDYMSDKKYCAMSSGGVWDVVSWKDGELICDQVTLDETEDPRAVINKLYG